MDSTSGPFLKNSNDPVWKFVLNFTSGIAGEIDSMKICGALLFAVKSIYPEKFEGVYQSIKEGKIRISSPMPVVNNELYVFKPKIMAKLTKNRKVFKNIHFVPESIAIDVIEKGMYTEETVENIIENSKNIDIKELEIPKVTVSRTNRRSSIFYINESFVREVAILIKMPEEYRTVISTALRFLGDRGVSKKATWGMGNFVIKEKERFERETSAGKTHLLVSRFAPRPEEMENIDFEHSYYDLKMIVGRNRGGISFRQRVLTEGNVLSFESIPTGKVLEMQTGEYKYSACLTGFFI